MKNFSFKMRLKGLAFCLVCVIAICGCHDGMRSELDRYGVSLSLFDVDIHGISQEEVISKLIEQTDEFDYFDDERKEIKRLMFCGIPFGLNLETEQKDGATIITKIVLITSRQSKSDFEAIKNEISKRYGNPDIEDYEGGTDETDGRFYGRCNWFQGGITLRNVHSEEGGLILLLSLK